MNEQKYAPVDSPVRFCYVYHWSAGSMPPPDHNEFDVTVSDQGGVLEYWNDYRRAGIESKKYFFKLDIIKTALLRETIRAVGYRNWNIKESNSTEGAQEWMEGEDGFRIPPDLCEEDQDIAVTVYEKVKELVPKGIWTDLGKA